MQVLIVNGPEIRQLLPMRQCMGLMAEALRTLARGDAVLPLRSAVALPSSGAQPGGLLLTMPAYLGEPRVLGLKVLTVFPSNEGTTFAAHQGAVLLFDPEHGGLRAILDATEITAIRTAAVSGVATRLLAREDAADLALLGSGVQGHTHLQAMEIARPIRSVRVWSRNPDHARAFVSREAPRRSYAISAAVTAREAVEGADIICTVTSAVEPVLEGKWIAPGTHVNAVGAYAANSRELDTTAVVRSRLFVDRRESALSEAGDFLIPKQEGAVGDDHIVAELGDVLLGRASGRRLPEEVTLFKSLGLAIEDAAAAHYVYSRALELGVGDLVELGGAG